MVMTDLFTEPRLLRTFKATELNHNNMKQNSNGRTPRDFEASHRGKYVTQNNCMQVSSAVITTWNGLQRDTHLEQLRSYRVCC